MYVYDVLLSFRSMNSSSLKGDTNKPQHLPTDCEQATRNDMAAVPRLVEVIWCRALLTYC